MLHTKELYKELSCNSNKDINTLKSLIDFNPTIIADIGANIGYYTESFLSIFPSASIHAYEPHPDNLLELHKLTHKNLYIHEYGLFNEDKTMLIGMRDDGRNNNGTYGIYTDINSINVQFKNADNESIYPDLVKMDVEGSELYILQCKNFFKNTKAILVELVYMDNFKQNTNIRNELTSMGFKCMSQINKNDVLWTKK